MNMNRRGFLALAGSSLAVSAPLPALAAPPAGDLLGAEVLPDLWVGNPDAKVTVIEYASLSCPHCAAFHGGTYRELKAKYIDSGKVRFVLREFPLDPLAMAGFILARCGGDREKRANMVDLLFSRQRFWLVQGQEALARMAELLKQEGMSEPEFAACLQRQDLYDNILRVREDAEKKFGVDSTPTFFVNGEKIVGNVPLSAFERLIDPVLK